MLVLSRATKESIVIGGVVTVKVIDVRGNKVRMGIEGPPEVSVHRSEIQDRIGSGETMLFNTSAKAKAVTGPEEPGETAMEKRMSSVIRRLLDYRLQVPVDLLTEAHICLDDSLKKSQLA